MHTQARDIGMILRKSREKAQKIKKTQESGKGKVYILESVRGFDLFPQTAHVESVAVLRLVDADSPLALASAPPQNGSEDSMEVENPVQGS